MDTMAPLNQRLDEVGWAESTEGFKETALRWMQQATIEIDRLTDKVERLERS